MPRPRYNFTLRVGSRVKYDPSQITQNVLLEARGTIVHSTTVIYGDAWMVQWDGERYQNPLPESASVLVHE